jgi:hypothetical protein
MVDQIMNTSTTPRRIIRLLATLAALASTVAGSMLATPAEALPPRVEVAAPPNRVAMFTDSVGLGAKYAVPRAFPEGWSVNVDGQPARFVEQLEDNFVKVRLATNPEWFGDHVVIAGGYNYPYWDPDRFDQSIDSMIDTLTRAGVKHVYWVTLREVKPQYISAAAWRQVQPYYWYFPTVNDHLRDAVDRHPNLTLVDWAAVADQPGLTYDAIHLNNTGSALYAEIIRQAVMSTATQVAAGSITKVHVDDAAGAVAAAVNITTTGPRNSGHLRAFVCSEPPPTAAVHTYGRNQTVAHASIVPLDANGDFCVFTHEATNLVVDVTGLFDGSTGFSVGDPSRWIDTRTSGTPLQPGGVLELDVADLPAASGVDATTQAIALVATAANPRGRGWLRVATCGTTTTTANVSYELGATTPNLVLVAPDAQGKICVTSATTTDVVVDVYGAWDDTAEIDASTAERLLDTRTSGNKLVAGQVVMIDLAAEGIDPSAAGVALNLAAVVADGRGHLTAYPCARGLPTAANLNFQPGSASANTVIVAPDADGKVCVSTLTATHLVVDLMGTIGGSFRGIQPRRALDTRS